MYKSNQCCDEFVQEPAACQVVREKLVELHQQGWQKNRRCGATVHSEASKSVRQAHLRACVSNMSAGTSTERLYIHQMWSPLTRMADESAWGIYTFEAVSTLKPGIITRFTECHLLLAI